MRLIVGLGNPGTRYANTRHNLGRLLVQYAAGFHKVRFQKKKSLQASLAFLTWAGFEAALAYPESYMNRSGEPVKSLAEFCRTDISRELLIVVDDAALSFGRYRLRGKGSDGGHNGLKSVNSALGTTQYSRLRIGIGSPQSRELDEVSLEEYVLSPLLAEEIAGLEAILKKGLEALELWIKNPLVRAMNAVNAH